MTSPCTCVEKRNRHKIQYSIAQMCRLQTSLDSGQFSMQSLLIFSEAVPLDIPRFGDERAQQDILAQAVRVMSGVWCSKTWCQLM